jgi:hypothetical protein
MYRIALALSVAALGGCVSTPTSHDTCDFLAESSALDVRPTRVSQAAKARWLAEVGLSNEHYRALYWYENGTHVRLVCLFKTKCNATVHAYRRDGAGWQEFRPPDAGILCATDA